MKVNFRRMEKYDRHAACYDIASESYLAFQHEEVFNCLLTSNVCLFFMKFYFNIHDYSFPFCYFRALRSQLEASLENTQRNLSRTSNELISAEDRIRTLEVNLLHL